MSFVPHWRKTAGHTDSPSTCETDIDLFQSLQDSHWPSSLILVNDSSTSVQHAESTANVHSTGEKNFARKNRIFIFPVFSQQWRPATACQTFDRCTCFRWSVKTWFITCPCIVHFSHRLRCQKAVRIDKAGWTDSMTENDHVKIKFLFNPEWRYICYFFSPCPSKLLYFHQHFWILSTRWWMICFTFRFSDRSIKLLIPRFEWSSVPISVC